MAASKLDQLRAMREARYETKSVSSRRVTKEDVAWAVAEAARVKALGPQPTRPYAEFIAEVRAKTGRPKVHATAAAKQRAYRERKRHAHG